MTNNNLLFTNKRAGASVGHKTVFTLKGAIDRYKTALEVVYNKYDDGNSTLDMGGSIMLGEMEEDLINNCGMKREEVEKIEIDYLNNL